MKLSELAARLDNTFERTGSGYREIVEAAEALREAEQVLLECHTLLGTMPLDTARLNRLWPRLSAILERTTDSFGEAGQSAGAGKVLKR